MEYLSRAEIHTPLGDNIEMGEALYYFIAENKSMSRYQKKGERRLSQALDIVIKC